MLFSVPSQQACSPSEFLILLRDVLSIQTQSHPSLPTPPAPHQLPTATQLVHGTRTRNQPLTGKDSLETAPSIHFREQTSFQEQRLLPLRNHSHSPDLQTWGKAFTVAPGASPSLSARRTAISWAPTCTALDATSSHLPRFLPIILFSTLKPSNFALGMSRMKCHLPIKRETEEKAMHHITHKVFEIKASLPTLKPEQ